MKEEKTMKTMAAIAMVIFTVSAYATSEEFLVAARRLYPTEAYASYTNSIVCDYLPPNKDRGDLPTARGVIRWYDIGGMCNFRDIGGWNGMPTGRAFRGSEPDCHSIEKMKAEKKHFHNLNVTADGLDRIRNCLGIRTDLDLRGEDECPHPETSALGVKLIRVPLTAYMGAYSGTNLYAKALRVFANPANYPIYFHCWGGADRTGTVAFLIEGLCGVSEADLCIDYELTSFARVFGNRIRFDANPAKMQYAAFLARMKTYPGATMSEKIACYMKNSLGLADSEIESIRRNLSAQPMATGD